MSNLLAALGRGQLRHLDEKVGASPRDQAPLPGATRRRRPGIGFMPDAPDGEPTNWLTVVTVDEREFGASPTAIREHLETLDIEARPAWKPMHLQPVFAGCPVRGGHVAEQIFRTGLCLPSGSAMTDDDVDRVVDGVLARSSRSRTAGG